MKKLCYLFLFATIVHSLLKAGEIKIQTKFVEASPKTVAALFHAAGVESGHKNSGVFSEAQFQSVIRAVNQQKGVNLLSAPSVITASGK